ncbi:hypothetical protein MKX01_037501 [Papaver californicum]|nr:hypothetical protein MKX01_037501 [Papaver californicum]
MSERKEKRDIECTPSKIDLKPNLSLPMVEQLIITTTENSSTSSPTRFHNFLMYVLLVKDNLIYIFI